MLSFASFSHPADHAFEKARHHPNFQEDDDRMDLDDLGDGEPRLTCPGETITSAHDFMRYVAY